MYEKIENRRRRIDVQIESLDKDEESLERVLMIFDRMVAIIPVHYRIVNEMVYSDRNKIVNIKSDLCKGAARIYRMREDTYDVISDIANTEYDNDELSAFSNFELAQLVDEELWYKVIKDE